MHDDSIAPQIELLAPAGSFETALAAFEAGADAVYAGLDAFSARAEAVNLSSEQLRDLLAYARAKNRHVYVTFNTLIDDADLPQAVEKLALLEELHVDGLIVQDLGIARLVHRHFPGIELHASTQLVAHNLEGVLALKELGFTRVVLAREMSLEEIRSITRRCGVEIEVFVHGALCYSISGLCLFSAMERNRSGNRGRCAYCCRLPYTDAAGARSLPFSMRDLRLDESLDALRDAGVASLKIEGRMKSPLYVASVTRRYRELLDGGRVTATRADLETVFSRRTTTLYVNGYPSPASAGRQTPETALNVIDPSSLGHLGTPIGTVKRLTKDREGRTWLRFHTSRALERHDGLQFVREGEKPLGFGISDLRVALSRHTVFNVRAGSDVEVLVPDAVAEIRPGATVYCSASNEVKRRFPVPPFRPSDYARGMPVHLSVRLTADGISAANGEVEVSVPAELTPAQHPERTAGAVRKAFSRLGETDWTLADLTIHDPDHLFAPASILNDVRRLLVERLDAAREARRAARIAAALTPEPSIPATGIPPRTTLKLRLDQPIPDDACSYDEVVVAIGHRSGREIEDALLACCERLRQLAAEAGGDPTPRLRLALPVFTHERDFNALRSAVKHMIKSGMTAWEASDLATLRLLRELGLEDITADWTLYAFNRAARAQFADLGIARMVASPESTPENLDFLASVQAEGPAVEFLVEQSTPLFLSLTRPATDDPSLLTGLKGDTYTSTFIDGLWVTARTAPRRFTPPANVPTRLDLSWDA